MDSSTTRHSSTVDWDNWTNRTAASRHYGHVLRGGSTVGRWTCDLQVAGSIPSWCLSRNIGQLSLASLPLAPRSLNRVPASAGGKGGILTSVEWQVTL